MGKRTPFVRRHCTYDQGEERDAVDELVCRRKTTASEIVLRLVRDALVKERLWPPRLDWHDVKVTPENLLEIADLAFAETEPKVPAPATKRRRRRT